MISYETGIAPGALLEADPEVFSELVAYRAEILKAQGKGK